MTTFKSALITGASSGLGEAIALRLAKEQTALGLIARDTEKLERVRKKALDLGAPMVLTLTQDLSVRVTNRIIDSFESQWQLPLSVLINNAGSSAVGPISEFPLEAFTKTWHLQVETPFVLIQQALKSFQSSGQGMIVNVGSGAALRALPYEAPYCAAKAALRSLSDSLRVELAGTPIHVLYFSPGPLDSPFLESRARYGTQPRFQRVGQRKNPEKIAEILFQSMQKKKSRVLLGWKAKCIQYLNAFFPNTVDHLLALKRS